MGASDLDLSVDAGPFAARHIGPREDDVADMLSQLGYASLEALVAAVVPEDIRRAAPLILPSPRTEAEILRELRDIAGRNHVMRSLIGMGYYGCHTPTVILRNVLENPAWYTAYTPYQAEISQGRLEALFNFQTLVSELTALPIANASLLDEPTAAAEAMAMCHRVGRQRPESVRRLRRLSPADDRRCSHARRTARDRSACSGRRSARCNGGCIRCAPPVPDDNR